MTDQALQPTIIHPLPSNEPGLAVVVEVLIACHLPQQPDAIYSYACPDELRGILQVGQPVWVPFGRQTDQLGYVIGLRPPRIDDPPLKPIQTILDPLPFYDATYVAWLQWAAQYYGVSLLTLVESILPPRLVQNGRWVIEQIPEVSPSLSSLAWSPQLKEIWTAVVDHPAQRMSLNAMAKKLGLKPGAFRKLLQGLEAAGLVRVVYEQEDALQASTQPMIMGVMAKGGVESLTKRQRQLLEGLQTFPDPWPVPLTTVLATLKTTRPTLLPLIHQGLVQLEDRQLYRDHQWLKRQFLEGSDATSLPHPAVPVSTIALNDEQRHAVDTLLKATPGSVTVLHGVTGSGKTEVYLALIADCLAQGQSAMLLVPEISLTPQLAKRIIQRFGLDPLCVWHSQLSEGERVDAWRRLNQGGAHVIVGARSAAWLPVPNLSLVILDEAHETSFKQDQPDPRYDARTILTDRAQRLGARVVLGSATPAVVQYETALQSGGLVSMTQRFGARPLAAVVPVDTRHHKIVSPGGELREPLVEAIKDTVAAGQQVMICLNRRGFFTLVECQSCGTVAQCPQCDVAVTVHKSYNVVRCHYCGWQHAIPKHCKSCASDNLRFSGLGTQRMVDELTTLFPEARLLRLDGDTLQEKNAHHRILQAFERHEADILVGTQMIAKGLDIANVTLVGVVGIDTMLNLPDYVSDERVFQMLTQVAGRAGRGDLLGRVLVQTSQPEHPVLVRAMAQDFVGFYEDERQRRHMFGFPPFSQLFRFVISAPEEPQARAFSQSVAMNLAQSVKSAGLDLQTIRLLGPTPCVVARLRNYYRYHLLVKNGAGPLGHEIIMRFFSAVQPSEGVRFVCDVDALNLL